MGLSTYFVYMMTNADRSVLYIGMTNDLERRVAEHREHVVPLALIRDHCEKMFSLGGNVAAVTKLLERHLKIVMISKAERLRLDFDLGLKVSMPKGWSFDDENADPFARLKAAGIEWDQIESSVA